MGNYRALVPQHQRRVHPIARRTATHQPRHFCKINGKTITICETAERICKPLEHRKQAARYGNIICEQQKWYQHSSQANGCTLLLRPLRYLLGQKRLNPIQEEAEQKRGQRTALHHPLADIK